MSISSVGILMRGNFTSTILLSLKRQRTPNSRLRELSFLDLSISIFIMIICPISLPTPDPHVGVVRKVNTWGVYVSETEGSHPSWSLWVRRVFPSEVTTRRQVYRLSFCLVTKDPLLELLLLLSTTQSVQFQGDGFISKLMQLFPVWPPVPSMYLSIHRKVYLTLYSSPLISEGTGVAITISEHTYKYEMFTNTTTSHYERIKIY